MWGPGYTRLRPPVGTGLGALQSQKFQFQPGISPCGLQIAQVCPSRPTEHLCGPPECGLYLRLTLTLETAGESLHREGHSDPRVRSVSSTDVLSVVGLLRSEAGRKKGLWRECPGLQAGLLQAAGGCSRAEGGGLLCWGLHLDFLTLFLAVSICCCLFILFLFLSELTGFITTEV